MLIGIVYAVCVLGLVALFVGQIVFTDHDPHANDGPIESIVTVSIAGTTALLIGVGVLAWLGRAPESARVGSIVLAALSVLTVVFFWSGAPGVLGACAAACAGLTRGGRTLSGAARVAGIVGLFIASLNMVLTVGGVLFNGAV
jgi:hypothetical protein